MDATVDDDSDLIDRVEQVSLAAARLALAAAGNQVPPVSPIMEPSSRSRAARLQQMLGLSIDEIDFLWSVIARAIDPRVGSHLRAVFGNEARSGISVGMHAAMRELSAKRCRSLLAINEPTHPLRANGLLEPIAGFDRDIDARYTAPARVWMYLSGRDEIDPVVASRGGVVETGRGLQLSMPQAGVVDRMRTWLAGDASTTLVLEGPLGSGRRTAVALAVAPRPVVAIDFARVSLGEAESMIVALRREVALRGAVPVLANLDELWSKVSPSDDALLPLVLAIDSLVGPVVVTTSLTGTELRAQRRDVLRARWPVPDIQTRRSLWEDTLADSLADDEFDQVAERYALGAGGIVAAARSATTRALHRGDHKPTLVDVTAGVQDNIAERLGELARRVDIKQDWSELVLAPDLMDDVKSLIGRVRHSHFVLEKWGFRQKLARGTGVAALFSGPPGTGKTMVAGLLAKELQLELYQVDLSRIVSKWVGETEKQLAKVFDAAESGHALLLFDEADSLFAKRSAEVKSATDRYANLEVNYLLQRVESFGGVVVLTTNLDTSIDPALRRRLASHIVFSPPEAEERAKLWREMLTTGAMNVERFVDERIDFDKLADEFPAMSGANIRNSVLAAAFLAASEDGTTMIGMTHLRRAARGEYRAMGHVLGREHIRGGRP